jgi:hypothetical protein
VEDDDEDEDDEEEGEDGLELDPELVGAPALGETLGDDCFNV